MRRRLLAHVDEQGGAGLEELVLDAVRAHRAMLEPPPEATRSQAASLG